MCNIILTLISLNLEFVSIIFILLNCDNNKSKVYFLIFYCCRICKCITCRIKILVLGLMINALNTEVHQLCLADQFKHNMVRFIYASSFKQKNCLYSKEYLTISNPYGTIDEQMYI